MKIGIDISMLVYRGSGVATYTYYLVRSLLRYYPQNEYKLFYSSLRRPDNFYYLKEFKKMGAKVYDYPFPPRILKLWWNKFHIFPVEWFIGKVDVFHSSDFLRPPLLKGTFGVTTIFDLTWKIFPEYHTRGVVEAHERKIKKTIVYQDAIIAISQNTKKDLMKLYPTIKKKNKVFVIYGGIADKFKIIKSPFKIKQKLKNYKINYPGKYLLYVGAIEPRKNVDIAIKVFNSLIEDKKYQDYKFLIVGRVGWKNEHVFALIKKLGLEKKIKFVGFVKDKDLPYFYNAAKVNIYLSSYEGFGLPPLEAAKCNCPTLIYKNSSIKEVFGDKYMYAKKGKEVETLKKLINSNNVDIRKYPKKFSWKKTSSEYISIFKRFKNNLIY